MNTSIIALFCCIADFAKVFEDCERKQLIPTRRKRMRSGKLSLSEMLFIMVLFHVSPFKNFKTFWHFGINQKYRDCFGDLLPRASVSLSDVADLSMSLSDVAVPINGDAEHLAPIAAAHDGTALLSSLTSRMSGVTTDSMALFTAIRVAYDRT